VSEFDGQRVNKNEVRLPPTLEELRKKIADFSDQIQNLTPEEIRAVSAVIEMILARHETETNNSTPEHQVAVLSADPFAREYPAIAEMRQLTDSIIWSTQELSHYLKEANNHFGVMTLNVNINSKRQIVSDLPVPDGISDPVEALFGSVLDVEGFTSADGWGRLSKLEVNITVPNFDTRADMVEHHRPLEVGNGKHRKGEYGEQLIPQLTEGYTQIMSISMSQTEHGGFNIRLQRTSYIPSNKPWVIFLQQLHARGFTWSFGGNTYYPHSRDKESDLDRFGNSCLILVTSHPNTLQSPYALLHAIGETLVNAHRPDQSNRFRFLMPRNKSAENGESLTLDAYDLSKEIDQFRRNYDLDKKLQNAKTQINDLKETFDLSPQAAVWLRDATKILEALVMSESEDILQKTLEELKNLAERRPFDEGQLAAEGIAFGNFYRSMQVLSQKSPEREIVTQGAKTLLTNLNQALLCTNVE
jgi:hypothetical protein